jgi:hypothetical protein
MAEPKETPLGKSEFASAFADLQPAILAEWPQVDAAGLTATGGELEPVIGLIAEKTAHTRALVRRQLEELYRVHMAPPPRVRGAGGHRELQESVDAMMHDLEKRAARILRELRGGMLSSARGKVQDNIIFSLLVSLGLGFIVGVLFIGWGRRGK